MYNQGIYFSILLLAVIGFVAACSSTDNLQRSENMYTSLQTVDNNINEIVRQIDAINNSLNELVNTETTDLRRSFNRYSENVNTIRGMERGFAENTERMKSNAQSYFNQWDEEGRQYTNPDIQARSDERRAELGNAYERVEANTVGLREAFQAYVSDVSEIESFLSNDLTSQGIESMGSTANTSIRNGDNLKEELEEMQIAIRDTRSKMDRDGSIARN
ncbi:hypothetical protein BH23BAC3_BH23BAC3_19710 [soil metagenome]